MNINFKGLTRLCFQEGKDWPLLLGPFATAVDVVVLSVAICVLATIGALLPVLWVVLKVGEAGIAAYGILKR